MWWSSVWQLLWNLRFYYFYWRQIFNFRVKRRVWVNSILWKILSFGVILPFLSFLFVDTIERTWLSVYSDGLSYAKFTYKLLYKARRHFRFPIYTNYRNFSYISAGFSVQKMASKFGRRLYTGLFYLQFSFNILRLKNTISIFGWSVSLKNLCFEISYSTFRVKMMSVWMTA